MNEDRVLDWSGYVRALLYGVQFADNPVDHAERIARQVIERGMLQAGSEEFVSAIRAALTSGGALAPLIAEPRIDEKQARDFLAATLDYLVRYLG